MSITNDKRFNPNGIIHLLKMQFADKVLKDSITDGIYYLDGGFEVDNGKMYVYKTIDTTKKTELKRIAERMFEKFIKEHPDNNFKLFKEIEIDRAERYQKSLVDYKRDKEQKSAYYMLERWIEFLKNDFISETERKRRTYEVFEKRYGITVNKTFSFVLLKKDRLGLYEKKKQEFILERKKNELEAGENELTYHYNSWLSDELKVIERWQSVEKDISRQIEISKYKEFVESELGERKSQSKSSFVENLPLPNRPKVLEKLDEYGFTQFLGNKNLSVKIKELIIENEMPYRIALLKEIGFLDYFFKEYAKTKEHGFELLSKVFEYGKRRIKGNINVLNPKTKEDKTVYTSHKYKETVRNDILGL